MGNTNTLAIILGTLGVIFMVSTGFQILPWKWAVFLGIACFFLAGMVRRIGMQQK